MKELFLPIKSLWVSTWEDPGRFLSQTVSSLTLELLKLQRLTSLGGRFSGAPPFGTRAFNFALFSKDSTLQSLNCSFSFSFISFLFADFNFDFTFALRRFG